MSDEPRKYYVVTRLMTFRGAFEVPGMAVNISWPDDEPQRFLPVFETREAAEEYTDDDKYSILTIQERTDND